MSTISNYKKEAKKLFFMSVKNNLNKWYEKRFSNVVDFYSPSYNEAYFVIDKNRFANYLLLRRTTTGNNANICIYKWLIIPLDFKVWWYVRKLKIHFKRIKNDEKNAEKIEFFKAGIKDIGVNFVKEIRKEKLIQIEK